MLVFSETIGTVDLEVYDKNGTYIISHTSLKALFEKIRNERPLKVLTEVIYSSSEKPEYLTLRKVLVDEATNHLYEGIGEVNPLNLNNDISKAFPHSICDNRALDNAFLSFLRLDRKYYSSSDIPVEGCLIISEAEIDKTVAKVEKESDEGFKPTNDTPFEQDLTKPIEAPVETNSQSEYSDENDTLLDDSDEDLGKTIIPFGKHKGKSLAECDEGWIKWLSGKLSDGQKFDNYADFINKFNAYVENKTPDEQNN